MKRFFLLLLWAIMATVSSAAGANRAYKTFSDAGLYADNGENSANKKIGEIQKGDTVFATAETDAYIAAHDTTGFSYLPVTYNGISGKVSASNIYPVRLESTDTLHYLMNSAPKRRSPFERFMVPQMEWAMNHSASPATWLWWALGFTALACCLIFVVLRDKLSHIAALVCGLPLVAISGCEIMYILSCHNNLLWFIMPSCVGGWGHTILNFLLLAVVIGVQCAGLWFMWILALNDSPDEKAPKFIINSVFWPVLLGIALMIMVFIDSNDIAPSSYLIALGTLLVPAVLGMAWMFYQKRFSDGFIYPAIFLAASLGLSLGLMIMSMLIILLVVVIAILAVVVIFAMSAFSALFGGERVKVITNDGRTVSGTKNWDGTVSGDDGKKYHVK